MELAGGVCGSQRPGRRLFLAQGLGALVLSAVFAVSFILPSSGVGVTVCMFRRAFGIACPGCGLTRSFIELSHGHLTQAFRMHPLGPVMYAAFAFYMVKWVTETATRRYLLGELERKLKEPVLWGFMVAILTVWVCRLAAGG